MSQLWMEKVESGLEEIGAIPLWGNPPPFLWEECAKLLQHALGCEKITLSCRGTKSMSTKDLGSLFGPGNVVIPLHAAPVEGVFYFVLQSGDVATLTHALLSAEKQDKGARLSDPKLQEGFIHYIGLEVLLLLSQHHLVGNLSFSFAPPTPLPEGEALCSDIHIEIGGKSAWGKLICPHRFHHAFKAHFATEKPSLGASPLLKTLDVSLSLNAGSVHLSKKEWDALSVGDCVLLDRCSLDLATHKGSATAVLGNTPLFHVRIKHDNLKILDYAFYQEESPMMTPDEEGNELNNEAIESEAQPQEQPHLIPTDQIPVVLTVEVGRVKMSLEQLLQMVPGNVLELPIRPEASVHLTTNGNIVAKGELVKIGDAVGVKILKLGR